MTHHGSTLIEISVAAAVLAALMSVALCSTSAANKTSDAEALVLRQTLLSLSTHLGRANLSLPVLSKLSIIFHDVTLPVAIRDRWRFYFDFFSECFFS